MIIGITKESWLESLSLKEGDEYLKLVDALVVVTDKDTEPQPPYYFVNGSYRSILTLLQGFSACKAYPQKTLFSVNFSLVEITEGMTPKKLKEEWDHELQSRHLV